MGDARLNTILGFAVLADGTMRRRFVSDKNRRRGLQGIKAASGSRQDI